MPLTLNSQHEPDKVTLAWCLTAVGFLLHVMPARRVILEISSSGLGPLWIPALIFAGIPALSVSAGVLLSRVHSPGGRFVGGAIGLVLSGVALMGVLAWLFMNSLTDPLTLADIWGP
ncbi:hypothetical protein [Nonomuraea sp. NEAU-A123]|uniref:hypothetical protein n=1 Tax=Nonomuraea sp. NEAU-A123 TaxID=2839649 RepID=UPI001BE43A33|nr:hypothetical protein [Nonomuraea sp. NEAU-A123]MBT2226830.1 hypothetical protein [Nonomuraea sp. NEAU-A123]